MGNRTHHTIAIATVILFGIGLFYTGTDGFTAFTAESARTSELMREKPAFPNVTLEDSEGRVYTFEELANGKYVFLTFMYTGCTTVCPILETNMARVYDLIPDRYKSDDIVFLSISFDPERDDPATLAKYRTYFGSDGETWRMARINDQAELDALLDAFGVIAIPDGYGDFQHNVAFYLVDRQGRLLKVMDYTEIEEAAHTVTTILDSEGGNMQ